MAIERYRLPTTLIDIARETNTSVSTVSRVLAGGTVWGAHQREIHAIVCSRPRSGLGIGRTSWREVFLLLRKQHDRACSCRTSAIRFTSSIASFIQKQLYPHGYSLLVCNSGETGQREAEHLEMLPRKGIDGFDPRAADGG